MIRQPDIFLTPGELDARADALDAKARTLPKGPTKDQAMKDVSQDRRMANMKRVLGEPENRAK